MNKSPGAELSLDAGVAPGSAETTMDAADRVVYALVRPAAAARSLWLEPSYALALIAICILTAVVGFARSGLTINVLSMGGVSVPTDLLRQTQFLALLIGPAGEIIKVGAFAYLFWAGIVFIRPISLLGTFAAVVHAEVILVVGTTCQTLIQLYFRQPANITDLDAGLGLNLLIPVASASPWLPVLSRISPFFFLWGVFLTYWLHFALRISRTSAACIVVAYWVAFTALLVSLRLMLAP